MNKPVFIAFLLLIASQPMKAQENLVPNGSFEEFNMCPSTVTDFSVTNWYPATDGTPDYFHLCNNGNVGVPENSFGNQPANSGNAYCGIGNLIDTVNISYREYIQVKLTHRLEKGKLYSITFFVNLADSSKFSSNSIGVLLTNNNFYESTVENLMDIPQIQNIQVNLNNSKKWIKIEHQYLAIGDEEYLTIGCFKNNYEIDKQEINTFSLTEWYLYIDDVSLSEIKVIDLPNIITPNSDYINDEWIIDFSTNTRVNIVNRWGELVYSQTSDFGTVSWNGRDQNDNECKEGVYFYKIETESTVKTGFIQLIR